MLKYQKTNIAVIGLGYVGFPLALEMSRHFDVVGFDISKDRIESLKRGHDSSLSYSEDEIKNSNIKLTSDLSCIADSNVYIVAVPTPIDKYNQPDLNPLLTATESVSKVLSRGDIVIYESTVYPGVTEDKCVPLLEKISSLKVNEDFSVGYSPERANPGDLKHKLKDVVKIISASSDEATDYLDFIYGKVVDAGLHRASSIKIAEAAKVIENIQRDVNIALMNELSIIFSKIGIDTKEVIEAASTKWNFNCYYPGLVGGHCIGVDPYYLTHKSKEVGYLPEMILAGRRVNESMGRYVAHRLVKLISMKNIPVCSSKALIVGLTFKENCPDLRNTKVIDIINYLKEYNISVDVYDPIASRESALKLYNIEMISNLKTSNYDAIVLAVPHSLVVNDQIEIIKDSLKQGGVFFDVKASLKISESDERL